MRVSVSLPLSMVLAGAFGSTGLITRHDVNDERFLKEGERFEAIVHFPMGEGTLIAPQWVLTAGHIGNDLKRDMQSGYSPTARIGGVEHAITNVFVHPAFVPIENDIALLRLEEIAEGITPVRLPTADLNEVDRAVLLFGMGDMGNGLTGPQKWDKRTRGATNRIDSVDDKWISFRFDAPGDPRVTELEGISGPGDSGGPAVLEDEDGFTIIGISSNQTGSNGRGRYGQVEHYTRVSRYLDWIRSTMGPTK